MATFSINADEAARRYSICPMTGDLLYRVNVSRRKAGERAGYRRPNGYLMVWVGKKLCLGHRVIWTIVNGPIPDGMQIDHKDGNSRNNEISNLRLATHLQNNLNKRVRSDAKTGVKGVQFHPQTGKWRARIRLHGKQRSLGLHDTLEQASIAYANAAIMLHDDFARVS